ncbi:hydantoinase/oxoprolinase family protein [Bremerella sp. JC770]|uniref:hydantoinase/oxoprolinase family protein n=1 Tax=Bremerella sp. JC770 TaxID=3232137 RepID=UPI003458B3BA
MTVLGVDVGGANIKIATGDGFAYSFPFAIWKKKHELVVNLKHVLGMTPVFDRVAVTMTAELADCFGSKAEGVRFVLAAIREVFTDYPVKVYTVSGEMVSLEDGILDPHNVAAANWHALGRFGGQWFQGKSGLVVDVGSTTTDIIPLIDGQVASKSKSDLARLLAGELVYLGVERTPICGITDYVNFRGKRVPVANEWFATSIDILLALGLFDEEPENHGTADGRPATREFAKTRLARMICADGDEVTWTEINEMARELNSIMVKKIATGIRQVVEALDMNVELTVISGHGDFLAEAALDSAGVVTHREYLTDLIGANAARCAPAYALATLAQEAWD